VCNVRSVVCRDRDFRRGFFDWRNIDPLFGLGLLKNGGRCARYFRVGRRGGGFVVRSPLVENALFFDGERHGQPFANEARGHVVDRAEVRVNLFPETVEQLDDQSALNLEFFRELINPYTRHACSRGLLAA
jgi:hypothetical protein